MMVLERSLILDFTWSNFAILPPGERSDRKVLSIYDGARGDKVLSIIEACLLRNPFMYVFFPKLFILSDVASVSKDI